MYIFLKKFISLELSLILIIYVIFIHPVFATSHIVSNKSPDFNSKASIPDLIDKDLVYSKEVCKIDKNLKISNQGKLSFVKGSRVLIDSKTVENNNTDNTAGILFSSSTLIGAKSNILSTVTLKDSVLTFADGKINKLTITGTTNIAVQGTTFDTLEFIKLGSTDSSKTGAAFSKITVKTINIDIMGLSNDVIRQVNIRDAQVTDVNLKGYINLVGSKVTPEDLKTNFTFIGGKIKKISYTDNKIIEQVKLHSKNPLGFFNFKDTTIEDMQVSLNLLRGITLDGVTINNFKIVHTNLVPVKDKIVNEDSLSEVDSNKPTVPEYSNLQLVGLGTSFIKNLYLNSSKVFNIQGETAVTSYNAPLSSIYIQNISGYKDTNISLYNLKAVYFGIERPKEENPSTKLKDRKPEREEFPGGKNDTLNITRLYRVSTLGVYDNTVELNWNLEKNSTYKYDQYLSIYNLSQLKLVNSLVDVSKTTDLKAKIEIKSNKGDTTTIVDKDPDPRKVNSVYDYNITYDGKVPSFGSIFYFENSGAIKNKNRKEFVPLRIKTNGNSFITVKDIRSDLDMQLNGERNLFILESNKYNKNYTFHTNYNFSYLKPKDGKQKEIPVSLQYNYWDYNENIRVEQNWYTFKSDILIVDPKSKEYQNYKDNHSNELPQSEKDFGTAWFTYWQPYKVDKKGNPSIKDNKNSDDKEFSHGDQLAWDQKTNGEGRGGFPVEFGNKIQVENAKVTFLKPLDNLTVLEVVDKGNVNFHDMNTRHVSTKKSQWLTILRMRGGILSMAKVPMYVDKLQVYSYGINNEAIFRPVYEVKNGSKVSEVLNEQKLVVNKEADFKNNYLKIDLYYNNYFTNLNQKVTLNVLELGEYKQKIKVKEGGKDVEKEVIKKATIKNLKGVNFEQGLLFATNYYWKDNNLFVDITRTKSFGYFITNIDSSISNILDNILNKYSLSVDKVNKINLLDKIKNPNLSSDTLKLINELFKCKDINELKSSFMSLRPLNNELVFNINNLNITKILDSIKHSNNYSSESSKSKLVTWYSVNTGNNVISNTSDILGNSIRNLSVSIGAHTNFAKVKFGVLGGHADTKYESAYISGKAPLYSVGMYSDLSLKNGYFIKLASLYSIIKFLGDRQHYFMDDKTNFNFSGKSIDLLITYGKTYLFQNGILTPFISLNSGYSSFNSYQETGGSGALNVKGFSSPYSSASFGLEYAKEVSLSQHGSLVPKLGVIYNYKYYHLKNTVASFSKVNGINNNVNQIKYSSNNYGKNSILINTGINYILNVKTTFSSNFNAEIINKNIKGYNVFFGCKYSL